MSAPVSPLQPTNPALRQHTPTPWELERGAWVSAKSRARQTCIVATCDDEGALTTEEHEANAAFIVEAVNSHATLTARNRELEAALRLAEDVLSRSPFSTAMWPNGMHPQTGIEIIRAALLPGTPAVSR